MDPAGMRMNVKKTLLPCSHKFSDNRAECDPIRPGPNLESGFWDMTGPTVSSLRVTGSELVCGGVL